MMCEFSYWTITKFFPELQLRVCNFHELCRAAHRFLRLLQVAVRHEISGISRTLSDSFDILSILKMTERPSNISEKGIALEKFLGKL